MNQTTDTPVNRLYKSRIFAMLYQDKKELLDLYNAISGKHYEDPELLEINTLENAIYMTMRNDLSFLIDFRLSLYEHQSTYSPNLPLRDLFYISDLYSGMVKDENLYGIKLVQIPAPQFVIFYNGMKEMPDRTVLRLSDAYSVKEENPALELTAVMLNINRGHNEKLKGLCKSLKDYSEYTARVREYADTMPISEAVEQAICECIQEGILAEFLKQNRAEAKQVSIYEYDEEKHMRQERETFWEDGWAAGREEGIREGEERGREFGRKEGRQEGKLDLLKDLIQKKLSKGKSTGAIAEELEIEEALVSELVQEMEK
ncbi:hypothetical protein V6B71_01740 [Mediterraneibacter gnavus]|uniref:hypothetical protein n=1 Tax=Mediterraneibacter gnavus TaxID=33038 RepID=UPI003A1B3B82